MRRDDVDARSNGQTRRVGVDTKALMPAAAAVPSDRMSAGRVRANTQ